MEGSGGAAVAIKTSFFASCFVCYTRLVAVYFCIYFSADCATRFIILVEYAEYHVFVVLFGGKCVRVNSVVYHNSVFILFGCIFWILSFIEFSIGVNTFFAWLTEQFSNILFKTKFFEDIIHFVFSSAADSNFIWQLLWVFWECELDTHRPIYGFCFTGKFAANR